MYSTMATLLDLTDADNLAHLNVIGWGCPIPFFGHVESSQIATVGINPSNREFVGNDGIELIGHLRRLPTLQSLGLEDWAQADFKAMYDILSACQQYFEHNPYTGWFGTLQHLIEPTGHSYYSPLSNACHLDLVPWATSLKWGTMPPLVRKKLIQQAASALLRLIASSSLRVLILNGREVVRQFENLVGLQMTSQRVPSWDLPRTSGNSVAGVAYHARLNWLAGLPLDRELLVLGYNHNLQSSFGVTSAVRHHIRDWISTQYRIST